MSKLEHKQYICANAECKYYKKNIEYNKRDKYTGCNKYADTWQCSIFYWEDLVDE